MTDILRQNYKSGCKSTYKWKWIYDGNLCKI